MKNQSFNILFIMRSTRIKKMDLHQFIHALQQEACAYLKAWLEQLKEEPAYLFDILVDVNKAARMILDRIQPGTDREPCTVAA